MHMLQRPFQPATSKVARGRCRGITCRATHIAKVQLQAPGTSSAVEFAPLINGCWQFAGGHGRDVFDNLEVCERQRQ